MAWKCSPYNHDSADNAQSLTFRFEGTLRWDIVSRPGPRKLGNCTHLRREDPLPACVGRDTSVFSIIWEEWDSGGSRDMDEIMAQAPDR